MKELPGKDIIKEKLTELRAEENKYSAAFREAKEKVTGTIEQLKEYSEEKIRKLANALEKLRVQKEEITSNLSLNKSQLVALEAEVKNLDSDLKKATQTTSASQKWNSKRDLSEKAYLTLNQVREELLSDIRERVQKRTEEIFKKLITRHWQIDHIEIDENYKIRVMIKKALII